MEPYNPFYHNWVNAAPEIGFSEKLPFGYDQVFAPWATRRYPLSIQGLHEELIDVYNWLRPSQIETKIRYQVFEKVTKTISERWANLDGLRVSVFGSLRTKLFLPSSDIDVLVEYEANEQTEPANEIIKATAATFLHNNGFTDVSTLTDTPVPIIKVVDKDTKISIDISFNTQQGVRAAEHFEKVRDEFPSLEPLVFFLKQYLSERLLNYTFRGGLSSYGLILMTNYDHLRYLGYEDPRVNLGILLLRFLEIFALEFNYSDLEIKVKEKQYVRKSEEVADRNNYLSIEDPLLAGNDVGRSTYNIQSVRFAFEKALISLKSVLIPDRPISARWKSHYRGSILGNLLTFKQEQIEYRLWLKGFTLKWVGTEPRTAENDSALLLVPPLDLDYVKRLLDYMKLSKRINIVHPAEALKTNSTPVLFVHTEASGFCSSSSITDRSENEGNISMETIELPTRQEELSDSGEIRKPDDGDLSSDGWEDVKMRKQNKKISQKCHSNVRF
ncbi:unnamed protein product, partial [Mesorhabditis belari]|uniref:Polynucleotide adenylyltransferase n=1 Tax=Mesorhabditis belari TaxID=2138241 RepID=A0AAF3ECV6_9BILA